MFANTARRRTLAAGAALTAACFTLAVPVANAGPKPEPQTGEIVDCPFEVQPFAAQLRAEGLTAQAANNAAQLTVRDCLAAYGRR